MALYRTRTFDSNRDRDILSALAAHGADLLPADAHVSATDSGHSCAIYSSDETHCEAVNAEMDSRRAASIEELRADEHGPSHDRYDEEDVQRLAFAYYAIEISPAVVYRFDGWHRLPE